MKMNEEEEKNDRKRILNSTVAYLKSNYPVLCQNGRVVRKAISGLSFVRETKRHSRRQTMN